MHPSRFFKEVEIIKKNTEQEDKLRQNLMHVHPMNFVCSQIKMQVYKVDIRYKTYRNNVKEATKYILMNLLGGVILRKTIIMRA